MKIPQIIGVLNVSHESENNSAVTIERIIACVQKMIDDGVTIVDIGAQSSRPGVPQITLKEERKRIQAAMAALRKAFPNLRVSIDTTREEITCLALQEGACMVNDISGGRFSKNLLREVAEANANYVLMHSQGTFSDMHKRYHYVDIVTEIKDYFRKRIQVCLDAGIMKEKIILDPGIGFSKSGVQNLEILKRIHEFHDLGFPLYIGLSRKKFIGTLVSEEDPSRRDNATTAFHVHCIQQGVSYIRTHNVKYLKESIQVLTALKQPE